MGKFKAVKVATPGTTIPKSPAARGRGRPKKKRAGTSRKNNYRTRYTQAILEQALEEIREKRMSMHKASVHFNIPKTTLHDRHFAC